MVNIVQQKMPLPKYVYVCVIDTISYVISYLQKIEQQTDNSADPGHQRASSDCLVPEQEIKKEFYSFKALLAST